MINIEEWSKSFRKELECIPDEELKQYELELQICFKDQEDSILNALCFLQVYFKIRNAIEKITDLKINCFNDFVSIEDIGLERNEIFSESSTVNHEKSKWCSINTPKKIEGEFITLQRYLWEEE